MALKPEKFPDWATEEEVDPVSGQVNRVEPPDFRKVSGWTRREIPPRQWLNWLTWKTARWIRWAEDQIENPDQSLTTNGYQVMPGGLIFQWFEYDPGPLGNEAVVNVPFPFGFPAGCLQVILGDTAGITSGTDRSEGASVVSFDNNSATVVSSWESFPATDGSPLFRFFAIGH